MNRRTLITGVAASTALALIGSKTPTLAQEEERVFKLEYGQIAKASRDYFYEGIRFEGAIRYDFSVLLFEDEDQAINALKQLEDTFIADFTAADAELELHEVFEVSVPQLGEESSGWRALTTSDGFDIAMSFIFHRQDELTFLSVGMGLADSSVEMVDILTKQRERIADEDVDLEHLSDRLPALADMPTGFAMTENVFEETQD